MIIRKASDSEIDCKLVFSLSNDPVVRSVSFNQNKIVYEKHVEWYKRTIKDSNTLFLLVFENEAESAFIGQLRFKRDSETSESCVISLSITEEYRGKGIGNQFLQIGIDKLHNDWKLVKSIIAEVKADNTPSNMLFRKQGFELDSSVNTYKKTI